MLFGETFDFCLAQVQDNPIAPHILHLLRSDVFPRGADAEEAAHVEINIFRRRYWIHCSDLAQFLAVVAVNVAANPASGPGARPRDVREADARVRSFASLAFDQGRDDHDPEGPYEESENP